MESADGLIVVAYDLFIERETATDRFIRTKIKALSQIFPDITIITNRVNGHSEDYVKVITPKISFSSKILNIGYLNLFALISIHKIKKNVKGKKPIVYTLGSFFIFLAAYLKFFLGIKVVVDVDTWFMCYDYSEVKATFLWYVLEKFIEPINKLFYSICINEFEADYLIRKGFNKNKLNICHNVAPDLPIKEKQSCRQSLISTYGFPPDSVIVAFHGPGSAAHNRESVKMITETAKSLQGLDRIKYLIIGSGFVPEEMIDKSLKSSFVFTGFLNNDKMYDALRGSTIYFCPIAEGFLGGTKTKITEGAMVGLPVVTNSLGAKGFDTSSVPFLFDDDMGKSIEMLYTNPELIDSIGRQCKEYVRKNYSYSSLLSSYVNFFSEISGYTAD
jgi:glycosyltransferase involved in cell wall biosynthesis